MFSLALSLVIFKYTEVKFYAFIDLLDLVLVYAIFTLPTICKLYKIPTNPLTILSLTISLYCRKYEDKGEEAGSH